MGQNVNAMPKVGNLATSVGEQTDVDFALLLNMQARNGVLQPRPGWRYLERATAYTAVVDPATPDGFAWNPSATEQARWSDNTPLGAFCFDGPDGESWVLSIWSEGLTYNRFRVTTTSGQGLADAELQPIRYNGMGRTTAEPAESGADMYVFARYYDTVFFSNGGALWRWQPRTCYQPYLCDAFHNPQNPTTGIYASGTIRGVKSLCVHQGSLILAGFARDTILSLDGVVDTTGDGLATAADANQVGGFTMCVGSSGVFLDPYTVMVSDTEQPLCFNIDNISQIGSYLGLTACASANEMLVLWTTGETFKVLGPVADPLSSTILLESRGIGCVGPRAMAQTDAGWLMWLGDTGVFAWGEGGPKKVSEQINGLFDQGLSAFWQWYLSATSTDDFPSISGLPTLALTSSAPQASAVWLDRLDTLCIAIGGACTHEPNSLILAWTPKDNRFAVWTTQSASPNWTQMGVAPNTWWQADPPTIRSAMAGATTLLVSANEPGLLIAQGSANDSAIPYVSPIGCLCAMVGPGTDQLADGSTSVGQFLAMAISAPVFIGDDDEKLARRVYLRMHAIRIKDFLLNFAELADTNPCWFFLMPESGHFDVFTDAQTASAASAQSFSPWPDAYAGKLYFWQSDNSPDATLGAWGDVPGDEAKQRKWLPLAPVDKRFDVPVRVGKWFRFAVAKVVDGRSDPALSLISAGIEVVGGYGPRR